ncbi:malonate--CoA ligase ACSF3, mitochondrial-like [Lethenteron reissneri]|uniref:malonate--CoA ligase ACSF3, mitochondrial-like n=1 Tax=Lethenteron reissneri TaxID=7753 RepID=UPI002AB7B395|nr:malonate--CoA ligase ACSF3, mitochondrial-like [Lethenteron reissneri]
MLTSALARASRALPPGAVAASPAGAGAFVHRRAFRPSATTCSSTSSASGCLSPVSSRAAAFGERLAISDRHGTATYGALLRAAGRVARRIQRALGGDDSGNPASQAVAFLCPNDARYVAAQWATWLRGSVAVPLYHRHPRRELHYVAGDCGARVVLSTEEFAEAAAGVAREIGVPHVTVMHSDVYGGGGGGDDDDGAGGGGAAAGGDWRDHPAMIVYTSGTTGRPKGVLSTHGNLHAQVSCLLEAWEWSCDDVILHTLPLHHTHGIINKLLCPLAVGASCVMLPEFDARQVWEHLLSGDASPRVNVFMAVPTVYARLIDYYDEHYTRPRVRDFVRGMCKEHIRLMVSGSAALPTPVLERWEEITGHRLLERYGMTELGMVLSNPLRGDRIPGTVGSPLPGVEVRIVMEAVSGGGESCKAIVQADSKSTRVTPGFEGKEGELQVSGPSVFKEYWRRPLETKEAFTSDGWFKTGDTAVYRDGAFRLLGRTSADIIKSGGYKISALEVEWNLLSHPDITDVAVIGSPDSLWGQRVTALVVLRRGATLTLKQIKEWARERMVAYTIPSEMILMDELPRNAMGKVNKKDLLKKFFP